MTSTNKKNKPTSKNVVTRLRKEFPKGTFVSVTFKDNYTGDRRIGFFPSGNIEELKGTIISIEDAPLVAARFTAVIRLNVPIYTEPVVILYNEELVTIKKLQS